MGLRGIVLAGFLAAIMSAISALANSTATIFSLDVYGKIINKNADDRSLVRVGRYASFAALFIAAVCAPVVGQLGGIFKYFQTGVTYLSTPISSVILLGLFWKRANYAGAKFGLIFGIDRGAWLSGSSTPRRSEAALGSTMRLSRKFSSSSESSSCRSARRRRTSRNGNRSAGIGAG